MSKRIIIISVDDQFAFVPIDGIEEVTFPNKEAMVEIIKKVYDESWIIEDKSRTRKIKNDD